MGGGGPAVFRALICDAVGQVEHAATVKQRHGRHARVLLRASVGASVRGYGHHEWAEQTSSKGSVTAVQREDARSSPVHIVHGGITSPFLSSHKRQKQLSLKPKHGLEQDVSAAKEYTSAPLSLIAQPAAPSRHKADYSVWAKLQANHGTTLSSRHTRLVEEVMDMTMLIRLLTLFAAPYFS